MTLRRLFILCVLLWATLPVAAQQLPDDFPDLPGRMTDSRDGETYSTVEIEGREWMTENLRYRPEGSEEIWCRGDSAEECGDEGALYSHRAALEACPPGWRLPRVADWRRLIETLGGSALAVRALAPGGTAGFDLSPAGHRENGRFAARGEEGFWWSRDRAEEEGRALGLHLVVGELEDPSLETATRSTEDFAASVRCLR